MKSGYVIGVGVICASCSTETVQTSVTVQADFPLQGMQLHGIQLQGSQLQGMSMLGFQYAGATKNGTALSNLRVEKGELVAEQNQVTLRGLDLADAHLYAQVRNLTANPPTSATVEYRITAVEAEDATLYDQLHTGNTYLYTLEQNVDHTGTFQLACPSDADSRRVAIPLTATYDEAGTRADSSTLFTFGCTTGVIAKCYRWGYRPWVTGYGDLPKMHWICTRAARADYCGDGKTHTHDNTLIEIWDNLPSPGPITHYSLPPLGMVFEAGWDTGGAVCLSHARWLLGGNLISNHCPGKLIPPGLGLLGGTVCDTVADVLGLDPDAKIFNASDLNLNLDVL
jgi:hypothetical protein